MTHPQQLTLLADDLMVEGSLLSRFWDFHRDNPHVYRKLRDLALQLKRRGHERYGIKGLFEVLRWHRALETTDESFKLNNNYHALYARLLMKNERELKGFFALRASKGDEA
jgi:hypothetical protein